MKVGLVACTSRKHDREMTVEKLYSKSPLFRYSVEYCKKHYEAVYALSAKHGLLPLNKVIKPYDLDIWDVQRQDFKDWLKQTAEQTKQTIPLSSELYFFASTRYRKLIPLLDGYTCHEPLNGMGIGQQLRFLKEELNVGK